MSALTEKLKFLITADTDDAIRGFEKVGKSAEKNLAAAESGSKTLSASMVKYGAVTAAAGAIAIVGLGKTASAFQDAAIAAGRFSVVTGMSVDASSRWLEVGKDMGIEGETLTKSFGFMEKQLGKNAEAFDAYGVAIAKTSDGATDVNGTFLNVVARLNEMTDPAQRAAAGAAMLGRGWQGIAEVIGTGAGGLADRLAAVGEQQVFTDADVAAATKYRDSMDELHDTLEGLVLSIGQGAAPVLGGFATQLSGVVGMFTKVDSVTSGALGGVLATAAGFAVLGGAISVVGGKAKSMGTSFKGMSAGVQAGMVVASLAVYAFSQHAKQAAEHSADMTAAAHELSSVADEDIAKTFVGALAAAALAGKGTKEALDGIAQANLEGLERARDWSVANGKATEVTDEMTAAIGRQKESLATAAETSAAYGGAIAGVGDKADATSEFLDGLRTAYDLLTESINDDQAWRDLQDQFDELKAKQEAAFIAAVSGAANAEQAQRDYQTEIGNTKLKVGEYATAVLGLPEEEVTKIIAGIDWESVDLAETTVADIARDRYATIFVQTRTSSISAGGQGVDGEGAVGRPVLPGNTYRVGEFGPETLKMTGTGAGVVSPSSAPSSAPAQQLDPAAFGREAAVEFARVLRQQMRAA